MAPKGSKPGRRSSKSRRVIQAARGEVPVPASGKKGTAQDPTDQVRIRSKKPLIERVSTDTDQEPETVSSELPIDFAVPASMYLDEAPTEIATGPLEITPGGTIPDDEAQTRRSSRRTAKAAAPRGRLEPGGTEAAAGLAARARLERVVGGLTKVRSKALNLLRQHLTPEELAMLDRALMGELEDPTSPSASSSPKRLLEHLLHSGSLRNLDPVAQAPLLKVIARDATCAETLRAANAISGVGVLESLGPEERSSLMELFGLLDPRQREGLAALAGRLLRSRSSLEDRDPQNTSLIRHLLGLANTAELAEPVVRAGLNKQDVVTILISSLASPHRIALEEGNLGVLGCLEFGLADSSPAECARLWRGLVTGDLRAQLPGSKELDLGTWMRAKPRSFGGANTPLRAGLSLLPNLIQTRAKGGPASFVMPGGHSLDADLIARCLELLYGAPYSVSAGPAAALRALGWASSDRFRVPPVFLSLLYAGGERIFVFDRMEDMTLYFRAPHGSSSKKRGSRRANPDRQVEDPAHGIESIPIASAEESIGVVLAPRS